MTTSPINNLAGKLISPQFIFSAATDQEQIDLNDILRTVLEKYKEAEHKNFILRFDILPFVTGSKDQFICLFDALIKMIISHPPDKSKLFLYVKCSRQNLEEDIIDLSLNKESAMYRIDFYSNITTDAQWEVDYNATLSDCAMQANKNGGNFSFSPISNTGCLFSLILPGKIN